MKVSFAVLALLGLAEGVQVQQHEIIEDNLVDIDEQTREEIKAKEGSGMADGCWAGVRRFESGADNSWTTFKNAMTSSAQFEDKGFPTNIRMLVWEEFLSNKNDAARYKNMKTWKRPALIERVRPSLWGSKNDPVPEGIAQGGLGDCWFLAAASALAEDPKRIRRILWNKDYSDNGAFRFSFWVKNKWHGVNIDDQLPATSRGTMFARKSKNGAYWLPLLEKAYAKLDQNYERLSGGMPYESLRTMTNMPTTYVSNAKGSAAAASWAAIERLAGRNFPMTSPCCNNRVNNGLVSGHAYTLLDAHKLSTGQRLVKMRNPWAFQEYKGDWSDSSSKWTAALKEEVGGVVNSNDGTFWMDYETYIKEFWGYSITMYAPYKGYHQIDVKQTVREVKYTVTNPVAQELYIHGETYANRNFPRTCNPGNNGVVWLYNSSGSRVGNYGYMGWAGFGMVGSQPGVALPAGTYEVRLWNQSAGKKTLDATLSFYWATQKGTVTKK